jgi:phosphoribosylformimino-5-aminoimidazole carboxamide ribotide isomerase
MRSHYQPLRSILHPTSEPLELVRAYREHLGLREIYVADLDAISGLPPEKALYQQLAEVGGHLWIDAGLTTVHSLEYLSELKDSTIVLGLETAAGPSAVRAILEQTGPARLMVSLDLFEGAPRLPEDAHWDHPDIDGLLYQVVNMGVRRVLLLDLARVGTSRGTGVTDPLWRLRESQPQVEVSVGGGISGIEEVIMLRRLGAASVLVGSALHDGRIGPEELNRLRIQDWSSESERHSTSAD